MARHTITHAEQIFSGPAIKFGAFNSLRGLPVDQFIEVDLGTPVVADPNRILDDATATDSAQVITTFLDQPDVPRNLTATGTAGSDHVVTVTGKDVYGETMVEALTLNGTNVITGDKAFATITQVDVAVGAAGDTFDLGIGSALGLPYRLDRLADAIVVAENNVGKVAGAATATAVALTDSSTGTAGQTIADSGAAYNQANQNDFRASITDEINALIADVAALRGGTFVVADSNTGTSTTGDIRGTYTPVVTLDGSTPIKLLIRPAGRTTTLAYGVAQFAG